MCVCACVCVCVSERVKSSSKCLLPHISLSKVTNIV